MEGNGNTTSDIKQEYKTWKQNTPFLYDFLISNSLIWPSLTVSWIKGQETRSKNPYSIQHLLIGTQTSDKETNYLIRLKALLPIKTEDSANRTEKEDKLYSNIQNKVEVVQRIAHQGDVNKAKPMPFEDKQNIIATKSSVRRNTYI